MLVERKHSGPLKKKRVGNRELKRHWKTGRYANSITRQGLCYIFWIVLIRYYGDSVELAATHTPKEKVDWSWVVQQLDKLLPTLKFSLRFSDGSLAPVTPVVVAGRWANMWHRHVANEPGRNNFTTRHPENPQYSAELQPYLRKTEIATRNLLRIK